MSFWQWLRKTMFRRNRAPNGTHEFDEMLRAERRQIAKARQETLEQQREAQALRDKSWYLHGKFENAKTADPFSEWLFSDEPRGSTQ
jgi:NAD-dependent SIR2 family protein deacetylase